MDHTDVRGTLDALKSAMAMRDRRGVNALVRRLIEAEAPLGRQWSGLAQLLLRNGEVAGAVRASALSISQTGGHAHSRFAHAALLAQSGRLDEAERALVSLDPALPTIADHGYLAGTIALNRGQVDRAIGELLRVVRAEPARGQAWLALAMAGRVSPPLLAAMEGVASSMAMAPVVERAAWHHALGKAYLDLDRVQAGFQSIERGAQLAQALRPYDRAADHHGAEQAVSGWNRFEGSADRSRPILVTGLPRSGTTLVEQILSSHSAVAGGDELAIGTLIADDVGGTSASALASHLERGGSVDALRRLYLHLLDQRFPGKARVVDKGLGASRYLGLIATMFPGAPIVWVRRDPVDCAWSAYRSWFVRGAAWSSSLEDIAHHFRLEDRLHRQWGDLLGPRMLTIDYAALVEDPDREVRRLADHCGLPFEDAMLHPERTERTVSTNSALQVREPINRKGLGSSMALGDMLDPFRQAYFGGS